MSRRELAAVEWPTLALIALCYAAWAGLLAAHGAVPWLLLAIPLAFLTALHSSLQHEAIHSHPTRLAWLNEALVFPALMMVLPWRRYRDTHVAHHLTGWLTDPLDDPESYYVNPRDWAHIPRVARFVLAAQSCLAGRLVLGPAVMVVRLVRADLAAHRAGDRSIAPAWGMHLLALVPVALVLLAAGVPVWLYLLTVVWPATSLLMLRSYVEHRPAENQPERSVLVESGPLCSLVFLNNNLHALHHQRPGLPWYRLPSAYRAGRSELIASNGGYRYAGYTDVVRRHLFDRPRAPLHPHATDSRAS